MTAQNLSGRTYNHFFVDEVNNFNFFTLKDVWIPKKVIFNDPATIVYWEDGSKTVVKCGPYDIYDREKGFAMCVLKRLYGNNFHAMLKKHVPQEETKEDSQEKVEYQTDLDEAVNNILNSIFGWAKEQKIKPMTFQPKER